MPGPIYDTINHVKTKDSKIIYLSPRKTTKPKYCKFFVKEKHLVLLCGHYEGIDNRIIENYIDMEISIGDYVLTGGEIPALVLIDCITRLLPNVLSSEESFMDESHYGGLLEYPQYTRPREFNGHSVPDVLLSGNHKEIANWREKESIRVTFEKRPDLINHKK